LQSTLICCTDTLRNMVMRIFAAATPSIVSGRWRKPEPEYCDNFWRQRELTTIIWLECVKNVILLYRCHNFWCPRPALGRKSTQPPDPTESARRTWRESKIESIGWIEYCWNRLNCDGTPVLI
jgi:hypothetical protein